MFVMSCRRLELLPVELFHEIFGYFWADELLFSFHNLNSYFNKVLNSYQSYFVSFHDRTQSIFENIYQNIQPQQVISLTISDDIDTPGQPDLFISRYKLSDFIRLRSLTLIDLASICWESFTTDLTKLIHLRSFAVIMSENCKSWEPRIPHEEELDHRLFTTYSPILAQLNRLELVHGKFLSSMQFSNLRQLTIREGTSATIEKLGQYIPQLSSLNLYRYCHCSQQPLIFSFPKLKSLSVRIIDEHMTISGFRLFISNLPRLKHLTIKTRVDGDMMNGKALEQMTENLITFQFCFAFTRDFDEDTQLDLVSFRTPFWLEEKRWFVAFAVGQLFSVPSASMRSIPELFEISDSTLPNLQLFYDNVNEFTVLELPIKTNAYLNNVNNLILRCHSDQCNLTTTLNLSRIRHLLLATIESFKICFPLRDQLTNLSILSISVPFNQVLILLNSQSLKNIRKLSFLDQFEAQPELVDHQFESFFSIFPQIEKLSLGYPCSPAQIFNCLEKFQKLSTAAFTLRRNQGQMLFKSSQWPNLKDSLDQAKASGKLICTYRFDRDMCYLWLRDRCETFVQ